MAGYGTFGTTTYISALPEMKSVFASSTLPVSVSTGTDSHANELLRPDELLAARGTRADDSRPVYIKFAIVVQGIF
jgi:hypothetical protein